MKFFSEYKKQILYLLTAALAITALVTSGKKSSSTFFDNTLAFVITPLQEISSTVSLWFGDTVSGFQSETNLLEENRELLARIEMLESENKRLALYEEENQQLSGLLGIAQRYPRYETTATNVIGKDPGNWYNIFVIDKGENDGFQSDMVIMDTKGVVGKIIETGNTYSKVQTIIDLGSSVSAMSLRTGDLGVVRGDYTLMDDGLCKMEYIEGDGDIVKGDEIVTSHLSDIYPPGLTLGTVIEVVEDSNELTKYAIIEPPVDFKHLTTLLVITDDTLKEEGVE